jgi:hypothetical protein
MQKIEEIPWGQLEHAYGTAEEVPGWLDTLLTSPDEEKCGEAARSLYNTLWHQHTIFEATAPAVPFLIQALGTCPPKCRARVLSLLDSIASGLAYNAQHEDLFRQMRMDLVDSDEYQEEMKKQLGWVEACETAVWQGFETCFSLLGDEEQQVRIQIPSLLSTLLALAPERRPERLKDVPLDQEVSGAIVQERLPVETDPFVCCSCVFALSSIGFRHLPNLEVLERVMRESPEERVRICAAMCLVDHGGRGDSVDVLIDALSRWGETDRLFNNELPWFHGWLRFQLIWRLCLLPPQMIDRVLPALVAALEAASQWTADAEVGPILRFVFQGRKVDLEKGAATLFEPERAVLTCIYESDEMWERRTGNADLVFREIGLENDRSQWGRLLGLGA